MNVLIYDNNGKDINGIWLSKLSEKLTRENIEFKVLTDNDLNDYKVTADAIISLGGDGTLLFLNEFSNKTGIPLLGINTGNLGFLSEFERDKIDDAVNMLKNGQLIIDKRTCLLVTYNNKEYIALNEAYVHRKHTIGNTPSASNVKVLCDNSTVCKVKGDGVIISTPTGSTAYALSAGGPILSPNTDVISIVSIANHSFNQRPIVCGSDVNLSVEIKSGAEVGLFIDGTYIATLKSEDSFKINKNCTPTLFLRKPDFNFFGRLNYKMEQDLSKDDD